MSALLGVILNVQFNKSYKSIQFYNHNHNQDIESSFIAPL